MSRTYRSEIRTNHVLKDMDYDWWLRQLAYKRAKATHADQWDDVRYAS